MLELATAVPLGFLGGSVAGVVAVTQAQRGHPDHAAISYVCALLSPLPNSDQCYLLKESDRMSHKGSSAPLGRQWA